MSPRFWPTTPMVAIVAALVLAAPVAASSPWQTSRQAGTNAFASNHECTENPDGTVMCEGQSLDVFKGTISQSGEPTRKGGQVCYSDFTGTFDPVTEESETHGLFGCTLDTGTLSVDDLASITLAPTVIQLAAVDCVADECTESPGGSITVYGTWTGVGPVVSQEGKFKFDDGSCVQVIADRGQFRQASFVGAIDATEGMIGEGKFTLRTQCPF
jgi:hypothetical protein